jgi:hypothetical protein
MDGGIQLARRSEAAIMMITAAMMAPVAHGASACRLRLLSVCAGSECMTGRTFVSLFPLIVISVEVPEALS